MIHFTLAVFTSKKQSRGSPGIRILMSLCVTEKHQREFARMHVRLERYMLSKTNLRQCTIHSLVNDSPYGVNYWITIPHDGEPLDNQEVCVRALVFSYT